MYKQEILGRHAIVELWRIDPELLKNADLLQSLMETACRHVGATVIHSHFHKFGGEGGITGVVLLSESHASIHTWPELGYAALDVFMCGSCNPTRAVLIIKDALGASIRDKITISRGIV